MKWLLFALSLFVFLSCSSLAPVHSSPDTSSGDEKQKTSVLEQSNTLQTIEELKTELQTLKALLQTLKNTAGNLTPLLQIFEERLSSLKASNDRLQMDLTQASESLTALLIELATLKTDFEAYRQTVAENKIRNGIIIGGAGGIAGLILGLIIGVLAR